MPSVPQTLPNDVTPTIVYIHDTFGFEIDIGPPESPYQRKKKHRKNRHDIKFDI